MRLSRLNIKRFGIFRDEKIEDIGQGIVVIGGHNRAGKSTFLQILRNLGEGFHGIPFKDKAEFEIDADIFLQTNENLNISIKGWAEPKIKAINETGKEFTLKDIYYGLDHFTYKRLFTISLEELQKIPPDLENKEIERLQSVLLGAGLSEMLYLPQIEKEFTDGANKLGGRKGKTNVGDFKHYNKSIKEAIKLKNEAVQEVEEYYHKKEEFNNTEGEIERLKKNIIPQKKMEFTRIETLWNLYEICEEKFYLENQIKKNPVEESISPTVKNDQISLQKIEDFKEGYKKAGDKYRSSLEEFKQQVGAENVEDAKQKLLQNKEKINGFYYALSGLKEKTESIFKQKQEYEKEIDDIRDEMNSVNQGWEGKFERIETINTDQIERDKLNRAVEGYKNACEKIRDLSNNIDSTGEEKQILEMELDAINNKDFRGSLKSYFLWSLIIAVFGAMSASFINLWLGIFIGIAGIGGLIIFFINRSNTARHINEKKEDLYLKLKNMEKTIERNKEEFQQAEKTKDEYFKNLNRYINQMGLEKDISPDMVREYFRDVQSLKGRIEKVKRRETELIQQERELLGRFEELSAVIQEVPAGTFIKIKVNKFEEILEQKEKWFAQVENLKECLNSAETLELSERAREEKKKEISEFCRIETGINNIEDKLAELQQEIEEYNNFKELKKRLEDCTDRILFEIKKGPVKDAFGFQDSNQEEEVKTLEEFYRGFSSNNDVQLALRQVKKELVDLENNLEEIQKKYQRLNHDLKRLSTADKIEKAQKDIREQRANLLPLAEKYAVYRAAKFILGSARERMIEKTKNQSLSQAGEIFSTITRGEYSTILPSDELIKPDFKAVLKNDITQDTVDILSRGTREQLFFAVRVSRIKELDPLPVIVDDSLVNFDVHHLKQAVQVIKDLSSTHQVFVLTCHSEMVKNIAGQTDNAQYWKLEKGRFYPSSKDDLLIHLA